MTTIRISDNRLNFFYSQNPDFDVIGFNFFNGQVDNLNWENIEQETTLDLLKKYQRLLRINPDLEIAKTLLNAPTNQLGIVQPDPDNPTPTPQPTPNPSQEGNGGLDSAQAIASLTEEQFVKRLPGNEAVAREMHKKAIDIKAKTQLLWANMRDAVASPHFRSMRVSTTEEGDNAVLAQDIPSYQEMFGDLDYLDCEHCGSMFSAAAYVVDLMRIVDQYITEPNQETIREVGGLTLNQRRPDLAEIELTCDNTNTSIPYLKIINRILEARVKTSLASEDGLQSLATIAYPFNLPFNFPLKQVRSYLGHLKTDLGTIFQTFEADELAIAREYIGLSLEEYDLITNSETSERALEKLYGIEDLASLNNVEVFLKQTGLSRPELTKLLEQNLDRSELDAGLAHNFYINQVLGNSQAVKFQEITPEEAGTEVFTTIENLTTATLDRIHRFIRLSKKLSWSFADLDWVLTSINGTEIDEEIIKKIGKIKQLQTKYKLPLDVLCSFWHEMKTLGIGDNSAQPEDLFDRVFNNPFKNILGDKFFLLQDEIQQIELDNLEREAETNPVVGRILAALRLNVNQLIEILRAIWGQENTINLTVANLSQLFRTSLILQFLGLNIAEYQLFLNFLGIESIGTISIDLLIQITELREWIESSGIKINELDYITTGRLDPNLDIGYSETDIPEGMESLWQLAVDSSDRSLGLIEENVASFFDIEVDLASSLLEFAAIATQIPDLVSFLLTPVQQEQEEWSQIVEFFRFLSRMLMLTQKLELTPTELNCILENQEAFEIDGLSELTIDNIQKIYLFKQLITDFGDDKNQLVEYFASIAENEENNPIEKLAEITSWNSEQISLLVSPANNSDNNQLDLINLGRDLHKTVAGIVKLKQCFDLGHNLGVNVSWFTKLLRLENISLVRKSENWELYQDASQAVREVAKAKYDDDKWAQVSEKLEGELSEYKRDILTDWIVWQQQYENSRHLSQELLIDVETSSEVSVSPIKEATLAIQTYLHRCKMGLEPGVDRLNIPETWWQWLMNYRIWEANRKIFLYPENYLDPSLRKIKSPIYQEFEEELLQSEINSESVEKAYQNYFEKFAEIAQLKPAGGYRCTVENADSSEPEDTLYLFGRTATEPHTYYYQKCLNPEANNPTWEAWEKIDLVINSEVINAVYAFNKLFVFWVEILQLEKTKQQGNNQETEIETKATIKYSFQKFGKQWIQPQTLAKDIVIDRENIGNLWRKVTAIAIPASDSEPEKILTLFGDLRENDTFYDTSDRTQGISLSVDLLQENTSVILANQRSNNFQSILPAISANRQLKAIPTNNALYDNYADYVDDSTRGLVNYWSMDEGAGNVIGDRIGKSNGALKGSPKWKIVNDFPGADTKNVVEFDGVNDHIDCGTINLALDNYTITAWFKTSSKTLQDILAATSSKAFHHGILVEVNDKGNLRYLHRQPLSDKGGTGKNLITSEKYNDGKWHHVAVVKSSAKMLLYVDGSLKQETSSPNKFNHSLSVVIGKISKGGTGRFFKGQIAEVSVWNVALNAEQISDYSRPCVPLITENISKSQVSVTGVDNQPGWFTFDNGEEAFLAFPQSANGLSPIDNNLKAVTTDGKITLAYNSANNTDFSELEELKFTFKRLTTSTIRQLSQKMSIGGLDNLLTLDSQLSPELNFNRFSATDAVNSPNGRILDFDGSLGIYFWEIFFHIPFLVANTLNSNQRFAEAQKWYHYIFNPTEPKFSYPNLVGYWSIDEGDGNVLRDRIGDNYGKVEGDTQWEVVNDFPHTSTRNVLNFENEGYVKIPSGNNGVGHFSINDFSISLWFKTTDSAGTLISAGSATLNDFWRIYLEDGLVKFAFESGGNADDNASSNTKVNDDKWHYVTVVRDGHRSGKLYFDGVLVDDVIYSGKGIGIDATSDIFLGKNYDNTDYFQGQIAEVNICKIALSAEQVADASKNPSDRFWRFLPFRGNTLEKLQDILGNDAAIATYNNNPFDPHAIARLRIGAYEKAIVMKYIDNLLDWGDRLFAQDNRESINEATLLYFLAYDLLGEEPENLGKRRSLAPKTFQEIAQQAQNEQIAIPQFLIELENRVRHDNPSNLVSSPFNDLNTYFCAPENEQFIAYWQRVEDRLYKIRHSLNIEGIRRQLALFQPAIDPAQLVRAVAGGVTPLSVLSQLAPEVPNYRFDYMLERAKNTTSTLIQLGAALLSALEKKDAEELALLRSSHEQSILKLITTTKEKQIEEANETLNSLQESLASVQNRYDYYHNLVQNGLSANEKAGQDLMISALTFQTTAAIAHTISSPVYSVPTIFGFSNGGFEPADVIRAIAEAAQGTSTVLNQGSALADKIGSYERRDEEWEFQEQTAEIDIKQIEHQIEAQKIRVQIAEQELKVHQKSIEQAKEIEDFLKDKFTNQELYQWMVSRLSILYFQTYKIALDMAMATQSAYQYELTKNDTFINFNYWDSLKKGLLSGEGLMLGLNQLEKAYIEGNVRRFEIEKTISLLQLNPLAFQQLKETGKCELELSEKLFDLDFPGHYARLIKTLTVSIPAVVGPYQNISATLTQTSNKTLLEPDVNAVEYLLTKQGEQPDESILRSNWRRNQKIALSRAAMDNGLFELNFFWDTRYLPFEATGAVSTWELSLPKQNNPIDFDTISDVIITLSYTALDGGDTFRKKVTELSVD